MVTITMLHLYVKDEQTYYTYIWDNVWKYNMLPYLCQFHYCVLQILYKISIYMNQSFNISFQ